MPVTMFREQARLHAEAEHYDRTAFSSLRVTGTPKEQRANTRLGGRPGRQRSRLGPRLGGGLVVPRQLSSAPWRQNCRAPVGDRVLRLVGLGHI